MNERKTEAEIYYARMNRYHRQANIIGWIICTPVALFVLAILFFAIKG